MKEEMKGLYAAVILSIVVIFGTNWLFPRKPAPVPAKEAPAIEVKADKSVALPESPQFSSTATVAAGDKRVKIANAALSGSIRLKGARFDELYLDKYKQTLEADSPDVELLAPAGTQAPYYACLLYTSPSPRD